MVLWGGVAASGQQGPIRPSERFRDPYAWPPLEELVEQADTSVAGEVVDMRSAYTSEQREIFTTVTLRPDRRFRGGGRSLIRFRVPGGTVGDTRMLVTHTPVFAVGERALVFLSGESGRLPRVVGGEAGKRHLRVGEDGAMMILPSFALPDVSAGITRTLTTLDDLASELPRLLVDAPPR